MITKPYIIAGIVAVLLGGGAFAYTQTSKTPHGTTPLTVDTQTISDSSQHSGKKIAFSELLKQNGTYQCTVKQYVEHIESSGIVFINKDRIRADFTTQVQGMNIQSSMIVKDGYTYTWSSALGNRGMKIPHAGNNGGTQEIKTGREVPEAASYGFNGETIGDYDCKDWIVDESKFTLPPSIIFKDLTVQ